MLEKIKENRWYIYQKERFPILMYIPMIAAFSFSAVSYSSIVRNGTVSFASFLVSFITSFSVFMLLRIADEHKDYEEDCTYRPYRPVPRGLVKLKELTIIAAFLLAIQAVCGFLLSPTMLLILLVLWIYYFSMSKEFFCSKWLKKHPVPYMISHMFIMPLLDFYATACDFVPNKSFYIAPMVLWFISSSYFDGMIVEVGRKMRATEDEEYGVETYSFLWGRWKSVMIWVGAMAISMISSFVATSQIGAMIPTILILTPTFALCATCAIQYAKKPTSKNSKRLELLSGVWTIIDYSALGILPLLARIL